MLSLSYEITSKNDEHSLLFSKQSRLWRVCKIAHAPLSLRHSTEISCTHLTALLQVLHDKIISKMIHYLQLHNIIHVVFEIINASHNNEIIVKVRICF